MCVSPRQQYSPGPVASQLFDLNVMRKYEPLPEVDTDYGADLQIVV